MTVLPVTLRVRLAGVCALYCIVGDKSLRFFAECRKQAAMPGSVRSNWIVLETGSLSPASDFGTGQVMYADGGYTAGWSMLP